MAEPRPKRFPLAPMTVADILDNAIDLVRLDWRPLLLLGLLLALPMAIGTFAINLVFGANVGAVTGTAFDGVGIFATDSGIGAAIAIAVVSLVMGIVIAPLVYGAMTRIVAGSYLGREVGFWPGLRSVIPLWLSLIAASFIADIAFLLGVLALVVGIVVTQTLFFVVVPVIVIEEVGPVAALKRSLKLMSSRLLFYLAVVVSVTVVTQVISFVVASIPDLTSIFFGGNVAVSSALRGVSVVLSTMATTPFVACATTLIYFDARVRAEGFDIQLTAARGRR